LGTMRRRKSGEKKEKQGEKGKDRNKERGGEKGKKIAKYPADALFH